MSWKEKALSGTVGCVFVSWLIGMPGAALLSALGFTAEDVPIVGWLATIWSTIIVITFLIMTVLVIIQLIINIGSH